MKMLTRQRFAPALLAAALAPMALTAQAGSHGGHEGPDRERMEERMVEHRQAVYQRAEISEEKQAELSEAHTEHRTAMYALRKEHHERIAEILSDEEQEALRSAMHEAREQHRHKHAKRGHHNDSVEGE